MFKKKDFLLILCVLLFAGAVFLFQFLQAKSSVSSGYVRIWVDGKVHAELPLSQRGEYVIHQENGCENILYLTGNGFFMQSANCHNQLCVDQGEVTEENYPLRSLGTHILCLPNRVDAELVVTDQPAEDLPDI